MMKELFINPALIRHQCIVVAVEKSSTATDFSSTAEKI
jgi:hypothetical protein